MKLIDADALVAHLRNDPLFDLVEQYGITGVIEAQPTVDPVPVVHGRWIAHTMSEITGYDPALSGDDPVCTYSCSVCGEDCYVSDTGDDILSNYCPDCGARMDADYIIYLDESKLFENQSILAKKLVHCRDCKHRMHDKTCIKVMKRKPDDGFCDEAERKETE